jgi:hypothetical protein
MSLLLDRTKYMINWTPMISELWTDTYVKSNPSGLILLAPQMFPCQPFAFEIAFLMCSPDLRNPYHLLGR